MQNLQKNYIVIIYEGNAPPTTWKLGHVIGASPGTHDLVNLKMSEGDIFRSVVTLSL